MAFLSLKGLEYVVKLNDERYALKTHYHSQYYDTNTLQDANTVYCAPDRERGKATFRKLVENDIPSIHKSKISDFPSSLPASDVYDWAKQPTKPSYSFSEINGKVDVTKQLTGTIPSANLPSYVDDVIEGYLTGGKFYLTKNSDGSYSNLISSPESGKIYTDLNTSKVYRWSGSAYTVISETLALGTTHTTAYYGDLGNEAHSWAQSAKAHSDAKGSEFASDLYKIQTNSEGHVTGAVKVTKEDIAGIGVSISDTKYLAGAGLGLSGTTFYNAGVRSISTGSVNGTLSVNTNGTATDVAVKGLGSAAFVDSSTFAPAHTHPYLPLAGGTMTGALNFASTTKNVVGDDVAIGDFDKAGKLGVQGQNGTTAIGLIKQGETWGKSADHATISYDGSTVKIDKTITGSLSGNASTASKLATARTVSLTGSVTGSGTFDGSSNLSIATTTNHNHDDRYYTESEIDTKLKNLKTTIDGQAPISHKHTADDILSVNASVIQGVISSANLPSYVDDVLEYDSLSVFPTTGETGKIYTDKSTNKIYRWSGSTYVVISETLALGETSGTAYRGDRGKIAYDHSQVTGNPHGTTIANIANLQSSLDDKLSKSGGTMAGTAMISWPDTGNWSNENSGVTFPVKRGGLSWTGQSDGVKLFAEETESDNLELVLQFTDDNSNGLSVRNNAGTTVSRIDAKGNFTGKASSAGKSDIASKLGRNGDTSIPMTFNWAGKDGQPTWLWGGENGSDMYVYNPSNFSVNKAKTADSATTATKVGTTTVGNTTTPIYLNAGVPTPIEYTIAKSVPADAVFTDHTYTALKNPHALSLSFNGTTQTTYDGSVASTVNITPSAIGASTIDHTHSNIVSRGNVTAEAGTTSQSVSGLSMQHAYDNGYPATYGNVLNLNGTGQGQILVSWAGNGSTPASKMYFRGKTDNNAGDWSSWNEVYSTGNKPSWNDLSDKPTIPSVGNGTVTITQNGSTKGTFTLNQTGNVTIALTDTNSDTTYDSIKDEDIKSLFN